MNSSTPLWIQALINVPSTVTQACGFFSQEAEQKKEEAERQQEEEEGWVKVTRGHKGAKARPHSEAANEKTLQKEKRKKRRKELLNFYTWQHRNTQKERKLLKFKCNLELKCSSVFFSYIYCILFFYRHC